MEKVTTDQGEDERVYVYGDKLTFDLAPFKVLPKTLDCPVDYSCKVVFGSTNVNLCEKSGDNTFAKFDAESGLYEFQTTNRKQIPPGHYELEFTGAIGDLSDSVKFIIIIDDPCAKVEIYPSKM